MLPPAAAVFLCRRHRHRPSPVWRPCWPPDWIAAPGSSLVVPRLGIPPSSPLRSRPDSRGPCVPDRRAPSRDRSDYIPWWPPPALAPPPQLLVISGRPHGPRFTTILRRLPAVVVALVFAASHQRVVLNDLEELIVGWGEREWKPKQCGLWKLHKTEHIKDR